MDAFYEPVDTDAFQSTLYTTGPWDPRAQHGGPPAALLGRAFERLAPELRVRRVTVELLRPVPIATLTVRTEFVRAGKQVSWMSGSLLLDGKEIARASAVAIRVQAVELPPHPRAASGLVAPEASRPFTLPFFRSEIAYHTAVELRIAKGEWSRGPCGAWIRMRVQLVAGESPSPLQRTLVAADAGNGVSVTLPLDRYTFINPDLTVHLHRDPVGEWIGLDAATLPESDGTGMQHSILEDERGPIGHALESLVVGQRA